LIWRGRGCRDSKTPGVDDGEEAIADVGFDGSGEFDRDKAGGESFGKH